MVCLFCQAFGGESPVDDCDQKRKQTQKVQSFSAPLRIDKLKKHNKTMHPITREEYLQCSTALRKIFFDYVLESNTALSCFQEKPVASIKITVDKKVLKHLWKIYYVWQMTMKKPQLKPQIREVDRIQTNAQ